MNIEQLKDKWFGYEQVSSAKIVDRKTSQGADVVELTFVNPEKNPLELPSFVADKCITDEQSDLTKLRETRCNTIVEDLIKVFLESEVSLDDIPYCFNTVARSIEFSNKTAQEKLFGKKLYEINLMDIDKVLRQV